MQYAVRDDEIRLMMVGDHRLENTFGQASLAGSDAPMSMKHPSTLLAFFAAVFGPPAATTFGKLPGVFLPSPALIVGALADASTRIVFAAKIAHNNTGPVLHVRGVMADSELLNERKDIEIIWKLILLQFFFFFALLTGLHSRGISV